MQTINKVATTIEIKSKIKALEGDIRRFNLLFEKMYRENPKTFVWLKKRYIEGCSVGDIANESGTSPSTVRDKMAKMERRFLKLYDYYTERG